MSINKQLNCKIYTLSYKLGSSIQHVVHTIRYTQNVLMYKTVSISVARKVARLMLHLIYDSRHQSENQHQP
jgi:hypothetical protein